MKGEKNDKKLSKSNAGLIESVDNYNKTLQNSLLELQSTLKQIFIEYKKITLDKIDIKNKQYFYFIFKKGLDTVCHVFTMLLYYTKNIELTYYYSQQACCLYVEYIQQIYAENMLFLKLSSHDAVLFVFQKTIYNINKQYKKNIEEPNDEDKYLFECIKSYIAIFKNMSLFIVNNCSFSYDNKSNDIKNCCEIFKSISDKCIISKIKYEKLKYIYLFTDFLINKDVDVNTYQKFIIEFIKKIQAKKKLDELSVTTKLCNKVIEPNFIDSLFE